jgi:hypothetical protein
MLLPVPRILVLAGVDPEWLVLFCAVAGFEF